MGTVSDAVERGRREAAGRVGEGVVGGWGWHLMCATMNS